MKLFRNILTICLVTIPLYSLAMKVSGGKFETTAVIISVLNLALLVTAIISIKQYIWHSGENRMPFHVFNIIFTILFYGISLSFLISNRQYYEEFQHLMPMSVIAKFFFTFNLSSFTQWIIIASLVFNTLYIKRFYRDYYEAGIGVDHEDAEDEIELEEASAEK